MFFPNSQDKNPSLALIALSFLLSANLTDCTPFDKKSASTALLESSHRPHPVSSKLLSTLDVSTTIPFTIYLRPAVGSEPLPDLEYWQNTPLSQRKFPTPEEFAQKYGSSSEDAETVTSILEDAGLTITNQHLGAGTISALGTTAQLQSLFNVQLNTYQKPILVSQVNQTTGVSKRSITRTEIYHGYEGPLSLPPHLLGVITSVIGLDNRTRGAPAARTGDPPNTTFLNASTIASLYNFPSGISSSSQTLGIFSGAGAIELRPYYPPAITGYFSNQAIPYNTPPVMLDVNLTVGSNFYYNNYETLGYDMEITLDIEISATIAQGATVQVYFADVTELGWMTSLDRQIFPQGQEKLCTAISNSWEMYDEHQLGVNFTLQFQKLAALGVSYFGISGDWGSNDFLPGAAHVGYPCSDPYVTCVGGTVIGNVNGSTFEEWAWSDENNTASPFYGGAYAATGGGMSTLFPTPNYQISAGITGFNDSTGKLQSGGRFVPDVSAMVGVNGLVYSHAQITGGVTGTSCSSPLLAGLFTSFAAKLGRKFGLLNPSLYQLGSKNQTAVYRDVVVGNNDNQDTPDDPYYTAGTGYDPVTGWGSIKGVSMLAAL